jgi:hypothetical protein
MCELINANADLSISIGTRYIDIQQSNALHQEHLKVFFPAIICVLKPSLLRHTEKQNFEQKVIEK